MFKMPDLFGNRQAQQPAAPVAPVAQQGQQLQPQNSSGSVMIDNSKQGPNGGTEVKKESSPLEPFADLWNDKPTGETEGNSNTPGNTPQTPPKSTEPDFSAFAAKVDFSRVFSKNPELVQKALGGDVNAFGQVMNSITQASYAAALKSAHSMMGAREKAIKESIAKDLPQQFKQFSVANSGYSNEAYKHPALRPIVDTVKQQFLQKYPDATPAEIDTQVQQYLEASFTAAGFVKGGPGKAGEPEVIDQNTNTGKMQAQREGQFDWNKEFGLGDPVF